VVDLRTQIIAPPKTLGRRKDRNQMSDLQVIVIFIGDLLRYSLVIVVGLIMLWRKWKAIYVGSYFWVKLIQSILNVFSALLMVILTQLPFTDMILSVVSFALDQYFCIVIYSKWQDNKEVELLMIQQGRQPRQRRRRGPQARRDSQSSQNESIDQQPAPLPM
jgi:hypothetical protein